MNWDQKVSRKELATIGLGILLLAWLSDSKSLTKWSDVIREKLADFIKPAAIPAKESE